MSIHFIAGKPGGGKTLYSVKIIVDELVRGGRPIVTNVALHLDMMNEYLQRRYASSYMSLKHSVLRNAAADISVTALSGTEHEQLVASVEHITERIQLIDETDMTEFFCFRGAGVRLKGVSNAEWKTGARPDFTGVKDSGVLYVLDEVQNVFNSRAWASTGAQVLYYLSQHRKLGDDVVCITQAVNNVDKQFRSVAQDFTYIRNVGKARHGVFRLPPIFIRQTYSQPATGNVTAMETGTFRLDVTGLASLYDTAKGVGIIGRAGADMKERRKGVHWAFLLIGVPLLVWFGLNYLPRMFAAYTQRGVVQATTALQQKITGAVGGFAPSRSSVQNASAGVVASLPVVVTQYVQVPVAVVATNKPVFADDLFCTGYAGNGNGYDVFLSDGEIVSTGSGRIKTIMPRWIVLDGRKVLIRPLTVKPASGLGAVASPVVAEPVYIPVTIRDNE